VDEQLGGQGGNSAIALLLSVVLLVVSEAALFISVLWSLLLVLTAHSSYALLLTCISVDEADTHISSRHSWLYVIHLVVITPLDGCCR